MEMIVLDLRRYDLFWMQRVAGKDTAGNDAFAASLWASKSHYETCAVS